VVKRGFTHDMGDLLVEDVKRQLPRLEKQPHPLHEGTATSFQH
jgi:glutamate decarboxylase